MTVAVMEKIQLVLQKGPTNFDNTLFWAACNLAFFGFLRCSEFTTPSSKEFDPSVHLSLNDVALDSVTDPKLVQLTIKQSKTDPFRQGVNLYLAKTGEALCPVNALVPFLKLRGPKPGPLLQFQDGEPLTRSKFTSMLREILQRAGLDSSVYATHSFRIGAATSAHDAGISDTDIKMLGR